MSATRPGRLQAASAAAPDERPSVRLVPRFHKQGYTRPLVDRRRAWLEQQTGSRLEQVGSFTISSEAMRGNVENPIGAVQIPLGVAGPLLVRGAHAQGTFYVPLATTEGALVRSYERGMVAITRAGGAEVHVSLDQNRVSPTFLFDGVSAAAAFAAELPRHLETIRSAAESTTRHGRLLGLETFPVGREVIVELTYSTGDAHGMNMIVKATEQACRWIAERFAVRRYYVLSGCSSEKRASGSLLRGGKGKRVVAGVRLPADVVRAVLHLSPGELVDLWRHTVIGHLQAGVLGYNGHYANGLTALFIACGQDVANVANAAVGITHFELTDEGDLYASVTLPSLTVATVGGGTATATARECLGLLGCTGSGDALRLAEITAALLLAGELSMGGAIGSGEFVEAHESYGRNRPAGAPDGEAAP